MTLVRIFVALLLGAAVCGCDSPPGGPCSEGAPLPQEVAWVECRDCRGPYGILPPSTLLLYSGGCARIDFLEVTETANGPQKASYRIILPCRGQDVVMLATILRAMEIRKSGQTVTRYEGASVRYRIGAREGQVLLPVGIVQGRDPLGKGLYQHMMSAAHYELAAAIAKSRHAEWLALSPVKSVKARALKTYEVSFRHLSAWLRFHLETVVGLECSDEIGYFLSKHMPENRLTVDSYRQAWPEIARGNFCVDWRGNTAVVSFRPEFASITDLPTDVDADALRAISGEVFETRSEGEGHPAISPSK